LKDDRPYIDHILQAITKIKKYTENLTRKEFESDELIQDAVIRNIEIIGEATKNLSKEFRKIHSDVPWRAMSGMRDKLIHDYVGIDFDVVWETIKEDMPVLEDALKDI
jgi:uncharacterized protein with HEPN domain